MAQTYYTFDEAAAKLGISPDELKRRLREEWKDIRPFRDGATLRLRAPDIDAKLAAAKVDEPLDLGETGELFSLAPKPASKAPKAENSEFMLLPEEETQPIKPASSSGKPDSGRVSGTTRPASKHEDLVLALDDDDAFALPKSGVPSSGSKTARPNTSGPGSTRVPSSKAVSDSNDFELKLEDDDDDALDIGKMPAKDATTRASESGIMRKPALDSGISLEKDDEEIDFKLDLSAEASARFSTAPRATGPKTGIIKAPLSGKSSTPKSGSNLDDSSDFELTMDDAPLAGPRTVTPKGADKDIFEETGFDIEPLDESGSAEVDLVESDTDLDSNFDLDESDVEPADESGSAVVALEDMDGGNPDDDIELEVDEENASVSAVLRKGSRDEEDEDEEAVEYVEASPAQWGVLPALVMIPCVALMFTAGLMSFELIRGMWGYQQPNKPASTVLRTVAGMFVDAKDLPPE
jgi:hypothetical protein